MPRSSSPWSRVAVGALGVGALISPVLAASPAHAADATMTLAVAWADWSVAGDAVTVVASQAGETDRAVISASRGGPAHSDDSAAVPITEGEAVSLVVDVAAGNVAGYTVGIACDQPGLSAASGALTAIFTPASPAAATRCTVTMTRIRAKLTVAKIWAESVTPTDSAGFGFRSSTVPGAFFRTQTVSSASGPVVTATGTVLSGDTLELSESGLSSARYRLDVACDSGMLSAGTDDWHRTLVVPKDPVDFDCTFTNRLSPPAVGAGAPASGVTLPDTGPDASPLLAAALGMVAMGLVLLRRARRAERPAS